MVKSKTEIIQAVNEIKNIPLADLKKDPVNNSSGVNHKALIQYNVMLDNISIGPHTTTTITYAGFDWNLRLLGSQELIDIKLEVIKQAKKDDCFDEFYTYYLYFLKVIAKALTPSPFKTEGKTIFNVEDLKLVNFDVLEEIYKRYIDFVSMATQKTEEFTEEQAQAIIEIVKKNPEMLKSCERGKLLMIANYYINYSRNLEKIANSEPIN